MTENLRAALWRADDNPQSVIINFQARAQEEAVSFRVTTSAPIISLFWEMPSLRGPHWLSLAESRGANHYAIAITDHKFLDEPFILGLELDTDRDPRDEIIETAIWDKSDGEPQIAYIEFSKRNPEQLS